MHPFDHPDVIAGQGTVGLEILEQVPDVRSVLVGTGGGGLLGGVAAAVKGLRPDVAVIGVQAAEAACWPRVAGRRRPLPLAEMRTIADGIAVGRPGDVTFAQVAALVDDIVTVGEDGLARALLHCLERAKLLVEPAGAATVAALLEHPSRFPTPVVAVLSGGNVDPLVLLHVIQHGMAAAARYLSLRVRMRDRPGRAGRAARAGRHAGRQRARRGPLADLREPAARRRRGRAEAGDPRPEHRAEVVDALVAAGHAVVEQS